MGRRRLSVSVQMRTGTPEAQWRNLKFSLLYLYKLYCSLLGPKINKL